MIQTDEKLVEAISRGDRGALALLYDRYAAPLLAAALRILRERRECEDLVHDVFIEVWQKSQEYDVRRGSVRAWIFLRLRSRALDRVKSAHRSRVASFDPTSDCEPLNESLAADSAAVERRCDWARLRSCFAALSEEQRAVLELGYFEGLSSTEIAARVGVPVGTVKSRVAAAMARLRSALASGGDA